VYDSKHLRFQHHFSVNGNQVAVLRRMQHFVGFIRNCLGFLPWPATAIPVL
jgi:hypothetical protein